MLSFWFQICHSLYLHLHIKPSNVNRKAGNISMFFMLLGLGRACVAIISKVTVNDEGSFETYHSVTSKKQSFDNVAAVSLPIRKPMRILRFKMEPMRIFASSCG